MERYSIIKEKNPREIVLLRGSGCKWKKCTFCDYHLDFCENEEKNFELNKKVLSNVTGIYKRLEVINSGSFCDLDSKTIALIAELCQNKGINILHFECHYLYKDSVPKIKEYFKKYGVFVKIKTGVETFDVPFREKVLKKGFGFATVQEIKSYADEVCLLFGLTGQTVSSMQFDIETGLKYFERVCVNIMCKNSTDVIPNEKVIKDFFQYVAPQYEKNERVDILQTNTDFGVGSPDKEEVQDDE